MGVCVLQDVFYLTMEELFAFVDGRAVTNNLSDLAQIRKREFDSYRKVYAVTKLCIWIT